MVIDICTFRRLMLLLAFFFTPKTHHCYFAAIYSPLLIGDERNYRLCSQSVWFLVDHLTLTSTSDDRIGFFSRASNSLQLAGAKKGQNQFTELVSLQEMAVFSENHFRKGKFK